MAEQRRFYYPAGRVIAGAIIGFLVCFGTAEGKAKIDVKTKWSIKSELAPIKHGVIKAIDASNWAVVGEVGEDWALWIEQPVREKLGRDSVRLRVLLELRRPSLLTKGDLLRQHWIERKYALRDTLNNIAEFSQSFETKRKQWGEILSLLGYGVAVTLQDPKAAAWLVAQVSRELPSPTKQRILEGSLICMAVMPVIHRMCKGMPVPEVNPWGSQ